MKKTIVLLCLLAFLFVPLAKGADGAKPDPIRFPDPNEAATLEAVLKDPARSLYDKTFACKIVSRKGTAASVPVLAKYLDDPELAHPARIALLSIPGEEARGALADAIARTKDVRRLPGLLRTIGQRRESASMNDVVPFLSNEDRSVFTAACDAMTLLVGPDSIEPLVKTWKNADQKRREPLAAALFANAGYYLANNKTEEAARIYSMIAQTKGISPVTLGKATQGLIVTSSGNSRKELFKNAFFSDDRQLFLAAMQTNSSVSQEDLASLFIEHYPSASTERKKSMLDLMKDLKQPRIRDFLFKICTTTGDVTLRCKALESYAEHGTAADLKPLLESAEKAGTGPWDVVVWHLLCLQRIKDNKLDAPVVEMLRNNEGFLRSFMLNLGAGRKLHDALPVFLKELQSPDKWNRIASKSGCLAVMRADDLNMLLDTIPGNVDALRHNVQGSDAGNAKFEESSKEAISADIISTLNKVVSGLHEKDKAAAILVARAEQFSKPGQLALFDALAATGSKGALDRLLQYAKSTDSDFQDNALRVLGNWPNSDAADGILAIAKEIPSDKLRIRAIRAYIRVLRQMEMPATKRFQMANDVLPLITRDAEMNLLLEALSRAQWIKVFEFVATFLDKEANRETACATLVELGKRLDINQPTVQNVMKRVVELAKDPSVKQNAMDILKGMVVNVR